MTTQRQRPRPQTNDTHGVEKAYLIGAGIASLATAVFLIRDGHVAGKAITIFEETALPGGSLDGQGSAETGYIFRGGRMFDEEAYSCTYDLLASIPALSDPHKTVKQEMDEFNHRYTSYAHARLVANGQKLDVSSPGFSWNDRFDLIKILLASEASLGTTTIAEQFAPTFFTTNFWFEWCTTFAFQSWHSAVEFKRYLHRFFHEFARIDTLSGVRRTPYAQFDSIVRPIVQWLQSQEVHFAMQTQVTNLNFVADGGARAIDRIDYLHAGATETIAIGRGDLVFVTLGSMTADATYGSMTTAPGLATQKTGGSWALWETIAQQQPDFGHPAVFDQHIAASKWESFSLTFRDLTFFHLMEDFTGNVAGTGGLVTFTDSPWLMSVVLPHQPHFINQPKDVFVAWGYGLFPDKKGEFIQKPMGECTGAEILAELCGQLRFTESLPQMLATTTCIPVMMPYITSQFLPRKAGDRPLVIPSGARNFALLGQFCEIPDDVVFTVEYSVRAAQTAVYGLLHLAQQVPAIYKGQHDITVLRQAMETMLK